MSVTKIKKRNGSIVDFDRVRIETAMKKAFDALGVKTTENFFTILGDDIVEIIESRFADRVPCVEDVQDVVEKIIAQRGYFEVARTYIIYRYEHTKERVEKQREFFEKIEKNELMVVKRSGAHEQFSLDKLRRCLAHFVLSAQQAGGSESGVDVDTVAKQCRVELYDGITTKDVFQTLIMTTRSFIEQDPAYSKVAARLLRHLLYREVIGEERFDIAQLDTQYRESFIRNIKKGVEIGRLDPRLLIFDLEELSRRLVIDRDDLLQYMGTQVLYDRYFLQDPYAKCVLETPQGFWMRVAMGLSLNEKDQKLEYATKFYTVLSTLRFVSSTPTLFHSGTCHPQLASCYLNTVDDSLEHIFKVISDNAMLSKWSGGIGTDWTNVRATGALIKGTGVESQGIIPFLKVANDATHAINRSGRRRGAACVYLEVWHYDIEDFLELRKNTGDERRRTHDINTANWIPDLFMKRVREDGDWTLFSPHETPDLHHLYGKRFEERYAHYEWLAEKGSMELSKTVKARDLWKKMLAMLFETGHPWITFKDPSNVRSPQDHVGVVHNSNLCTEITLNTSEEETAVCNLGSVNFARHMNGAQLDRELIADTVATGMRMLDNVVDITFYPTKEARVSNMRHRPVGLGIMGFQDMLYMMNVPFDSERCVAIADESMELVSYHALLASSQLAEERGVYATYAGSKWDRGILPVDTLDLLEQERGEKIDVSREEKMDWRTVRECIRRFGMRNSNCMAIAPTATIGNISGAIPSIEPIYKNIYVKSNMSGDFAVMNPYLVEDLKALKLWDYEMLGKIKYHDGSIQEIHEIPEDVRRKYKEVFEIEPQWLIKAAAHRGKWIDQSQSLNIFFKGSSGKVLNDAYLYAWSLGLKGTYYLRTLAASQVEKSTVNTTEFGTTHTRDSAVIRTREAAATQQQEPPAPIAPTPVQEIVQTTVIVATEALEVPLCKIDDPSCESCQ
ncbi:MAG: ribonucleoside-diphosphate reductase subunit alpha [Candidatus Uhrbacteria bacterium]|nr:ribonucleoside-diphosphate reductase subunit alpha [Candidatus Uhrbacteria bacterium]